MCLIYSQVGMKENGRQIYFYDYIEGKKCPCLPLHINIWLHIYIQIHIYAYLYTNVPTWEHSNISKSKTVWQTPQLKWPYWVNAVNDEGEEG
jgi:hypothetical protein